MLSTAGYANMISLSPISTSAKNVVFLSGRFQIHMGSKFSASQGSSSSCTFCLQPQHSKTKCSALPSPIKSSHPSVIRFQAFKRSCFSLDIKQRSYLNSLIVRGLINPKGIRKRCLEISLPFQNMNMKLVMPKRGSSSKLKCNVGPVSWSQRSATAGLISGLFVCYSSSDQVHADGAENKEEKNDDCDLSHAKLSHGKKVYTDYSVTGIPGDGRCLFRSVAHGACLRSGKPAPSESLQRELADNLRARVADEFIKRREETEWFVEGDFDTYVKQIRKPYVWGGEPELFMASHVLQMPITVYMHDKEAGGLIAIAEYGQEYGKENPIRVLYHGFGHYDALQIPGKKGGISRL